MPGTSERAGEPQPVYADTVREPLRKAALAGRAWARPASGWLAQERARDPDRKASPEPGASSPRGQKRSGVFRKLVSWVCA
jgi:hypothetical protein